METSKAGLNLMFPPEWVRSCWGSCPRCGRWGTRWGSWRVCRCCWACCTASTRSCCGASPGSWSSCARTLTPGRRSGAGAACSSFSGCSTGLSDWQMWIQLYSLSIHWPTKNNLLLYFCLFGIPRFKRSLQRFHNYIQLEDSQETDLKKKKKTMNHIKVSMSFS